MKKILFSLLTVLTLSRAGGQTPQTPTRRALTKADLSGKIIDARSGLALGGASVYISDLKVGTTADSSGFYVLKNLPTGHYVTEVGYVGYKNVVRTLELSRNTVADFSLVVSITEESEVVVTGSSKATSIRRNPLPIVSVSKQYLRQNLSTNIIDAIARVPGINAVTTGPNVSKPFIRGLGFNRILTLYDGVRQEGQQWGDEHGIEVDQNTVERVEVVKGPASLIYGSDAVAGVVNLLPANPPGAGKIVGDISTEYQTNNGLSASSAMISGNTKGIAWMARGSLKTAADYRNKIDGRVYGTAFREADLSGLIAINRSWGYTHLGISTFNDLQEIPDGSRDSASRRFTKQVTEADSTREIVTDAELRSHKITPLHQRVQHFRLYAANNFIVGRGRLAINLAYQKSTRQEFSHPQVAVPGLYLLLNTFSYDAKFYLAEKNGWSITAGLNGMYQHNDADQGTEFIIPSYTQVDAGPFLLVKKSMKKIEISGGLRYDARWFDNRALFTRTDPATGFDKAVSTNDTAGANQPFYAYKQRFSGASGSVGLSYRFSDQLSGKFNIGRGYRAPNISEISANGLHPGTNSFQLGNLHFKPEFNLQEDIGINYNTPHVTVNAELFNNKISNYIFNQKISSSSGPVVIDTFRFQAAKAHLYGGELSVDIHPHPLDWLHFENSLSLVYGNNEGTNTWENAGDSGKYLPLIPPLHTFSELRANVNKVSKRFGNAFVKVQLENYAPQHRAYLQYNTETPTPGYHLFNAGFGADLLNAKGKTILSFSLIGDNLFDVAYQSHLNRLKYFEQYPTDPRPYHGIYNMGRNFSLKVNVPLNFSL